MAARPRARRSPSGDPLLIYGATGYSGQLLVAEARRRGLRPVLGGRNEAKLAELAKRLGLEHRVARLSDPERLDAVLRGLRLVVHAAGPFSETSRPMVDACLRTGTHYVDITGEVRVVEALAARDGEARRRKIMIMPGVGFDFVPTDCLAKHVQRRLPDARRLAIGVSGLGLMSRGSAKTLLEAANFGVVRRNGKIVPAALGSLRREFDYGPGRGLRPSVNVSWGDVAAAWYTTGIPDITVYAEATPVMDGSLAISRTFGWIMATPPLQMWFKAAADLLPEGPSAEERHRAPGMVVVVEAENDNGRRAISRLRTPEAYTFTATTAIGIAGSIVRGRRYEPGFRTPASVYGPNFPLQFSGVKREDVA